MKERKGEKKSGPALTPGTAGKGVSVLTPAERAEFIDTFELGRPDPGHFIESEALEAWLLDTYHDDSKGT
jgi:hypothetical protein